MLDRPSTWVWTLILLLLSISLTVHGSPFQEGTSKQLVTRQDTDTTVEQPVNNKLPSYAVTTVRCDNVPLVRRGRSLSPGEKAYVEARRFKAGAALRAWLDSVGYMYDVRSTPTLAMTSSGGGYRAMLNGAGVVQAMDRRDSAAVTSGLYQSLTYHAGLSGGSWLLTSLFGNAFDTVTSLSKELWEKTLLKNGIWPFNTETAPESPYIRDDMIARAKSGYPVTVTNVWGRFIEWQTLRATDNNLNELDTVFKMSSVRKTQAFRDHEAPYPIMTALGMEELRTPGCYPAANATQYEMHPYEFGSWDDGVRAFTPMEYLGTKADRGKSKDGNCAQAFDTFSFLTGSSSSKFNEQCGQSQIALIKTSLDSLLQIAQNGSQDRLEDTYGRMPNPFKNSELTPKLAEADELYLSDGGQSLQNNPIWPFLQPSRNVDVLIVNDNSADTNENWPNGTEIRQTYIAAKFAGLSRMPFIPDDATFVASGLNKRASFFGCARTDPMAIVYLPNAQYFEGGVNANQASSRFEWNATDIQGLIGNGNLVATQNDDSFWPFCLACALTMKSTYEQPEQCLGCYARYCFNPGRVL